MTMTEEIEQMKRRAARKKAKIEHALDDIRMQVEALRRELEKAQGAHVTEQTKIQRRLKIAQAELRKRENSLHMDCLRTDVELKEQIKEFMDTQKLTAKETRHFVLQVSGK